MNSKEHRLRELTESRKNSRWPGYQCIGDYCNGRYECDFVSPYSISAHNVDARLMVLLQDWASHDVLKEDFLEERCTIGYDPKRTTNIRLQQLLHQHFGLELKDIYATNVFPFIKSGGMNSKIKSKDLRCAAKTFALPQIDIVQPRIAVCLGKVAFDAVAVVAGQQKSASIDSAIASPFSHGTTRIWCQAHTGPQGYNNRNRGGVDVSADWKKMAETFRR